MKDLAEAIVKSGVQILVKNVSDDTMKQIWKQIGLVISTQESLEEIFSKNGSTRVLDSLDIETLGKICNSLSILPTNRSLMIELINERIHLLGAEKVISEMNEDELRTLVKEMGLSGSENREELIRRYSFHSITHLKFLDCHFKEENRFCLDGMNKFDIHFFDRNCTCGTIKDIR